MKMIIENQNKKIDCLTFINNLFFIIYPKFKKEIE
jgi:hypothetical protein